MDIGMDDVKKLLNILYVLYKFLFIMKIIILNFNEQCSSHLFSNFKAPYRY